MEARVMAAAAAAAAVMVVVVMVMVGRGAVEVVLSRWGGLTDEDGCDVLRVVRGRSAGEM